MDRSLRGSRLHLDAGLFADALDTFSRAVKGLFFQGERQHREAGHSWRIPAFQLNSLLLSDSCHQGKMIVGAALCVTFAEPAAYVAMLAGLRIRVLAAAVAANFFEPCFYIAIVGGIFCEAIGFWVETLAWRNYVHEFRRFSLDLCQQR